MISWKVILDKFGMIVSFFIVLFIILVGIENGLYRVLLKEKVIFISNFIVENILFKV